MKGRASINWKHSDCTGAMQVEVEGSTMMDTLDALKHAILSKMDHAPDRIAFGWTNVSISIERNAK